MQGNDGDKMSENEKNMLAEMEREQKLEELIASLFALMTTSVSGSTGCIALKGVVLEKDYKAICAILAEPPRPATPYSCAGLREENERLKVDLESSRCGVILQQEELDSLRSQLAAKEAEIEKLKFIIKEYGMAR